VTAESGAPRGFSLVEALVAAAVLGVAMGAALAAAGAALGPAERGRHEAAMALLAESLLERAGLDLLVEVPIAEGTAGGLRWRLERTPFGEPGEEEPRSRGRERRARLWRIEARVEDGKGAVVTLSTLELSALR